MSYEDNDFDDDTLVAVVGTDDDQDFIEVLGDDGETETEPHQRAALLRQANEKAVDAGVYAKAMEGLASTDLLLRQGTDAAQILIQHFGERDERVNAIGHDLLSVFAAIGRELRLHPELVISGIIGALPSRVAQHQMITNIATVLVGISEAFEAEEMVIEEQSALDQLNNSELEAFSVQLKDALERRAIGVRREQKTT